MISPNIQKSDLNSCKIGTPQELRDCQNCRYRHKGICGNFFEYNSYSSNIVNLQKLEKRLEISSNLRLDLEPAINLKDLFYEIDNKLESAPNLKDLFYEIDNKWEPALNLKDLFYEIESNNFAEKMEDIFPQKAKYDNFKLLTDIQRVLQNCSHLTNKEKALYCQSQRYFMKLYLREINRPD